MVENGLHSSFFKEKMWLFVALTLAFISIFYQFESTVSPANISIFISSNQAFRLQISAFLSVQSKHFARIYRHLCQFKSSILPANIGIFISSNQAFYLQISAFMPVQSSISPANIGIFTSSNQAFHLQISAFLSVQIKRFACKYRHFYQFESSVSPAFISAFISLIKRFSRIY